MMSVQSFMRHGKASVIVGGQFGSEAKGLAAAMVAKHDLLISKSNRSFISTTNAGAQAGHTTVLEDGRKFVCYHLVCYFQSLFESFSFCHVGCN